MRINIYEDKMSWAYLFSEAAVLYSREPIPREDVPEGWYCYDLRGTAKYPDSPYALVDRTEEHHAGSVLSPYTLKRSDARSRLVKDNFWLMPGKMTLAEFCQRENLPCPRTPSHLLRPASSEEAGPFHTGNGLTETGRQMLKDAADPSLPHSYDWYVLEAYNTAEEQMTGGLSLEEAAQQYTASENASKRLGVTKDGIAAVDLVIQLDGREWVSQDYQKSDSFVKDPVVNEAAALLRQTLEEQTAGHNMAMGGMN